MSLRKRLLVKPPSGALVPSEHFGVVLYEGDGTLSHSINGGKFGAGANFNGGSSFDTGLSTTNFVSDLNDRTVDFSFSCWAQIHSYPQGDNTIFYIGNYNVYSPNYAAIILDFRNATKKIQFTHQTQSILSTSTFNAPMTTWVHIAAIRDNSVLKLYINGSLESSVTLTADTQVSSSTTLDIGGFQFGGGTIYSGLEGKIDQVRVFQKALSSSEVSTLYAETTPESLDPLSEDTTETLQVLGDSSCIATYRFENNETDVSGNYNGTGSAIQYAAGRYGQAASFNGSSSKLDTGYTFANTTFSVSVWFKTTSTNIIITNTSDTTPASNNDGFRIYANKVVLTQDDVNVVTRTFSSSLADGNWHNVVITNDGTTLTTYIDGSSAHTDSSTSFTQNNSYPVVMGYQPRSPIVQYFDGLIDQVRIFNKQISAAEVTTLYQENSLVASYRFEGNANDDTRNYDGTATNVTYEYGLNGFTPDFVWVKNRDSSGENHSIYDNSRTLGNPIYPNLTNAEVNPTNKHITSLDTGGFTLGTDNHNANGNDYVAWCLKANGGTTSSNTDGTITSTVQANQDAGFSIVTYTGVSGGGSWGHGLTQEPEYIIFKRYTSSQNWFVFVKINNVWHYIEGLNTTAAAVDYSSNMSGSSTTITLPNLAEFNNDTGSNYIAYCFNSVEGFSKFGSYTGTGGNLIVETGFEPAFLMIKRTDAANYDWYILDNKRNPIDYRNTILRANANDAEQTVTNGDIDVKFLSNGFAFDDIPTTSGGFNASGGTYIYMAFAADPDTEAPTVARSFSTVTYTGTGSSNSITSLGFEPSLTWIKGRTNTASHQIFDTIRGATKGLNSDATGAEFTNTGMLTSFDSDGFTLGGQGSVNGSGVNYVAWNWKADDNEPTIFGGPAIAVYKFEDNLNDVTGNNNGTDTSITYTSNGKFNKAATFDGTNDSGSLPFNLRGTAFSISFWAKNTLDSNNYYIIANNSGSVQSGWHIGGNGNSGTSYVFRLNDGTTDHFNFTSSVVDDSDWHHVVMTFDNTTNTNGAKIYINGVLDAQATSSSTTSFSFTNSTTLLMKEPGGNLRSDGELDQLRIYQGALAQEQVTELYNETASDNDDLTLGAPPKSIVSANANAGFSIVKWQGSGGNATIGHGLSAAPEMIITKRLNGVNDWWTYNKDLNGGTNPASYFIKLNSTDAEILNTSGSVFQGTSPTSTVFYVGNSLNASTSDEYIAYCFHSVAGYSKFGSYTGNGGTLNVDVGFAADFVMVKRTSSTGDWYIFDSVRGNYERLFPNLDNVEDTSTNQISLTSTGFTSGEGSTNISGSTYIYMAFKIN